MNNVLVKPKADFTYKMTKFDGIPVISIIDKNLGSTSVTNDIENVVEFICDKERLDPKDCAIIYRDNFGDWDGWNPLNKWFISLSTKAQSMAIKKIIKFKHSQ